MALKYCDWARLVAMTTGIWTLWGAIWGLFYRKFFFDMINAKLGPAGLEPPPSSDVFISIIVNVPVVQLFAMFTGLFLILLDWPLPLLKGTILHRSHIFKSLLLFFHGFLSLILYQAFDSAFISFLAMGIYSKAQAAGEEVDDSNKKKTSVV